VEPLAASRFPGLVAADPSSAAVVTYLAYFLVQEGVWSNTLGKRLFGLRISRLDGSPCGWNAAFVRTVTRILEATPILFGGLPAALAGAFSKRHQRFGDMLSGCVVIRATTSQVEHGASNNDEGTSLEKVASSG